jgi:hypothetical protein
MRAIASAAVGNRDGGAAREHAAETTPAAMISDSFSAAVVVAERIEELGVGERQ